MVVHSTVEEEKKDGAEQVSVSGNENWIDKDPNDDNDDDSEEDEELGDLPPEVLEKIGKDLHFKSEQELESALVAAGHGDLPVTLIQGKPRVIIPSEQHNAFTFDFERHFERFWGHDKWGVAGGTHKIFLSTRASCEPDLSYWGYPRCRRNRFGILTPVDRGIPDVVIQFSWKNKDWYERKAIDDMMNRGLEKDKGALSTSRPTVGYLIKVRFSKKRKLEEAAESPKTQDMVGLDIYRMTHGTTIQDAEHWRYEPGGEEIFITITPQDLGIPPVWAFFCRDYKLKASDIFETINECHKDRQRRGLAM